MRAGTVATHQVVGMGLAFELARDGRCGRNRARRAAAGAAVAGTGRARRRIAQRRARRVPCRTCSTCRSRASKARACSRRCARTWPCRPDRPAHRRCAEPSYVLRALGRNERLSESSLRFGLGRTTSEERHRHRGRRSWRERCRGCAESRAPRESHELQRIDAPLFRVGGECGRAHGSRCFSRRGREPRARHLGAIRFAGQSGIGRRRRGSWRSAVRTPSPCRPGWRSKRLGGSWGRACPQNVQALRDRFAVPVEKLGRLLIVEDAWLAAALDGALQRSRGLSTRQCSEVNED